MSISNDAQNPFWVLKKCLVEDKINSWQYKKRKKFLEKNRIPVSKTSPNYIHHLALRLQYASNKIDEYKFKQKYKILEKEEKERNKRKEEEQKILKKEQDKLQKKFNQERKKRSPTFEKSTNKNKFSFLKKFLKN